MVERLARVVDPTYIVVWLRKPVPALEDEKPLDVIGRGESPPGGQARLGPRRVTRRLSAAADQSTCAERHCVF